MSQNESDLYPSNTFVDPMIMPLYLKTTDHESIKEQCLNDWLLNAYLYKITEEIVDEIEQFSEKKGFVSELINTTRRCGYAIAQFYKSKIEGQDNFKIFSPYNVQEWITEIDEVSKKKYRIGAIVQWKDDLDNNFTDSVYFDTRKNENAELVGKAYLVIWEKGDGYKLRNAPDCSDFVIADVSTAVLSIAIQARQIQATLMFGATNPFFYLFRYGDSITPPQRDGIKSLMKFLSNSRAIGAKRAVLDGIDVIENSAVEKSIIALDQAIGFFAGVTRLPLAFYFGERQTGGLGDTGEQESSRQVVRKKQSILGHFTPILREIFSDIWGESLDTSLDTFYLNKDEEETEEKELEIASILKKKGDEEIVNEKK